MVLLNGKKFKTYSMDTNQLILERIAESLNTLPRYLSFLVKPEFDNENADILVEDYLIKIINNAKTSQDDFFEFVNENPIPDGLDEFKDVFQIWLVYNESIQQISSINKLVLNSIATSYTKFFPNPQQFINFWNQRLLYRNRIENEIQRVKSKVEKDKKFFKRYDSIKDEDAWIATLPKIEKTSFDSILKINNKYIYTLAEIFNNIQATQSAPFVSFYTETTEFFKILKTFNPPDEWLNIDTKRKRESISVYVYQKKGIVSDRLDEFIQVLIYTTEQGELQLSTAIKTDVNHYSENEFMEKFLEIFPKKDVDIQDIKENDTIGLFFFPQKALISNVLLDLFFTDPIFSQLFITKEFDASTRKRTEDRNPYILFEFNHILTGKITGTIDPKNVDRTDPELRGTSTEIFPLNSPYIRARVEGQSISHIEKFKDILSKLFVLYDEQFSGVVEFYSNYVEDFGVFYEVEKKQTKSNLELLAPEIFVNKFSRYCGPHKQPTIVDEETANLLIEEGKSVIKFPRDLIEDNETPFPSDGVNQQWYTSYNDEYPFVGVKENNLINKEQYPVVPCCFEKDQTTKTVFSNYYNPNSKMKKDKKQYQCITTQKILDYEQVGVLPPVLEKIFSLTNKKMIRVGMKRDTSSFISCIAYALDDQTGYSTSKNKNEIISGIRKELSEKAYLSKQCMYKTSVEKIKESLLDEKVYIDPKNHIQLLENYFACNIFIFGRDGFILPNYSHTFYQRYDEKPCIFIYEHIGTESSFATYPQCELIVEAKSCRFEGIISTSFEFNDTISTQIRSFLNSYQNMFILNEKNEGVLFKLIGNPISQKFDNYGKRRQTNIDYKGTKYTLFSSPLYPIDINSSDNEIYKIPFEQAYKIAKKYDIGIYKSLKGDEIICKKGMTILSIPLSDVVSDSKIKTIDISFLSPTSEKSILEEFETSKRYARYLQEYILWVFSKFLLTQNNNSTDEVLAKFLNENINIDENIKYENIGKTFSKHSSFFSSGKITVEDEDMKKRIGYMLRNTIKKDPKKIEKYSTKKVISSYFINISDFDENPSDVILEGKHMVERWISEKNENIMNTEIKIGQVPYFFTTKFLPQFKEKTQPIFIAQNTQDLNSAINIGRNWLENGFNKIVDDGVPIRTDYNLYLYRNKSDIKHFIKSDNNIHILGYKIGGTDYFTVLMSV